MAHPFIYVVDCSTDDNGWQYFHHIHSSNNSKDSGKGPSSDSNDESTGSIQVEMTLFESTLTKNKKCGFEMHIRF